jgi:hypothetical protein
MKFPNDNDRKDASHYKERVGACPEYRKNGCEFETEKNEDVRDKAGFLWR